MDELFDNMTFPLNEKLLVLDEDLRVVDASPAFYEAFSLSRADAVHQHLSKLDHGHWNVPALLTDLAKLSPTDGYFDDFELHLAFPIPRNYLLNAQRSSSRADGSGIILLAITDVTSQPAA